jgi:N-acetylmuramic acid 6-phosphate etherase
MPSDQPFDPRLTEQRNPLSARIDRLSPLEIVELINFEDQKVAPAVYEERQAIARALELAEAALRGGGRLLYVGAGTSGRLGVLDASEMPPTYGTEVGMIVGIIAGGPAALTRSQEGAEDHPADGAKAIDEAGVGASDFVLGIASSGTTPFVHGALARAKERGAKTGFLLCTYPPPDFHQRFDVVIAPLVGPEVVTGSTRMKAGTATKLVLNTISTGAMIRMGKVFGNLMVDLRATNLKLRDRSERILMELCDLDRDAARQLLARAGGSVKTAIAMYWTGADPEEALRRLAAAGGRLDELPRARGGDAD